MPRVSPLSHGSPKTATRREIAVRLLYLAHTVAVVSFDDWSSRDRFFFFADRRLKDVEDSVRQELEQKRRNEEMDLKVGVV